MAVQKRIFYVVVPLLTTVFCLLVVLLVDHLLGRVFLEKVLRKIATEEREYRVSNPDYHHTLRPNYTTHNAAWGNIRYTIHTNSLGFKDESNRTVEKSPQKPRYVFIGDSFTEGIGHDWDETFVGIFAKARPDLEVLNAGVSSYSPIIYKKKLIWLVNNGYVFDEAVIYIDISDIQDEGFNYTYDNNDHLQPDFKRCQWTYISEYENTQSSAGAAPIQPSSTEPLALQKNQSNRESPWISRYLPVTGHFVNLIRGFFSSGSFESAEGLSAPVGLIRGMWTFEKDLPCYGPTGIEGAIKKATKHMTELADFLKERHIRFSVGVYPWPDQVLSDTVDSLQVQIWQKWCAENGCHKFIDHFPEFFAEKPPGSWPKELYMISDAHFSLKGNQLMANKLLKVFPKSP